MTQRQPEVNAHLHRFQPCCGQMIANTLPAGPRSEVLCIFLCLLLCPLRSGGAAAFALHLCKSGGGPEADHTLWADLLAWVACLDGGLKSTGGQQFEPLQRLRTSKQVCPRAA